MQQRTRPSTIANNTRLLTVQYKKHYARNNLTGECYLIQHVYVCYCTTPNHLQSTTPQLHSPSTTLQHSPSTTLQHSPSTTLQHSPSTTLQLHSPRVQCINFTLSRGPQPHQPSSSTTLNNHMSNFTQLTALPEHSFYNSALSVPLRLLHSPSTLSTTTLSEYYTNYTLRVHSQQLHSPSTTQLHSPRGPTLNNYHTLRVPHNYYTPRVQLYQQLPYSFTQTTTSPSTLSTTTTYSRYWVSLEYSTTLLSEYNTLQHSPSTTH